MTPDPPARSRRAVLRTSLLASVGLAGCLDGPLSGPSDDSQNGDTPGGNEDSAPNGAAVRWTYHTGGTVRNRPTLHDGTVYVGGGTNDNATSDEDYVRRETSENLYALDAADGSERWQYAAPAGVMSSPIVRDGVFIVVGWSAGTHGRDQRLVRVDDGSETWTTEQRDRFLNLLAVSDGVAYLGTADDQYGVEGELLIALQTSDGTQHWTVEAGDTTKATVSGDTLYVVEGGRRTTAVARNDGSERWHKEMNTGTADPRVFDGSLYLEADQENENGNYPVVAVRATDGSERWRFSVPVDEPFVPTGAVPSSEMVYVTEYGGWLFGVDRADGTERWRYETDAETRDAPVVVDDMVYLATHSGRVHAVDAANGEQQWTQTMPGYARIVAGNQQGLIVSGGNEEGEHHLRAYAPDGTERWSFASSSSFTRPAVNRTRAIVGTETGYIVAIGGE